MRRLIASILLLVAAPALAAAPTDIAADFHRAPIEALAGKGIVSGYPDGTFRPDAPINRAELAKILVGVAGTPADLDQKKGCFPDAKGQWYETYVCAAKEKGIVSGYPDGTFRGGDPVLVPEAIKMVVLSQGYDVPAAAPSFVPGDGGVERFLVRPYDDVYTKQWYARYVLSAQQKNILERTEGMLGITDRLTRGDAAEMLHRALVLKEQRLQAYNPKEEPGYVDPERLGLPGEGAAPETCPETASGEPVSIVTVAHEGLGVRFSFPSDRSWGYGAKAPFVFHDNPEEDGVPDSLEFGGPYLLEKDNPGGTGAAPVTPCGLLYHYRMEVSRRRTAKQAIDAGDTSSEAPKPVSRSIGGRSVIVHSPNDDPWYEVIGTKFNFRFSCTEPGADCGKALERVIQSGTF